MANPQTENGYTKIANDLYDAIARWHFSSYEFRVLIFIIRKTYGWNKKGDWISLSQFAQGTCIKESHVSRTLSLLMQQNIVTKGGKKQTPIWSIQKDFDKWKELPKGVRSHHELPKGVIQVTKGGNLKVKKGGYTKDTNTTKDTVTKDRGSSPKKALNYTEGDMAISQRLLNRIITNTPTFKPPNLEAWATECRLMRERDGRTEEQIRYLVDWSQRDHFWQANILSMGKLREKFDTLVSQLKRSATTSKKQEILI